ncbi:D-malate degradation protein R [Leminorella richardii]|uniref:D-malate degradation protein R n=1 Tax=Leminorella richardii TaxID=158841 RepID=A0A2X4V529_9GAMM|nr:LysR substrate-binding domain-containing protein [Leminorella richardii]SQI40380.1 D-malate degradation protein R [Leminorella richardii]
MISSDDLRFMRELASHSSLANAARYLGVSAASVTLRVKALEKRLGVQLIQRPARGLRFSEEGRLLLERADSILNDMEELQSLLDDRSRKVCGTLRVLAPLGFGNRYVAPLLAEFSRKHPALRVELTLSDAPDWSTAQAWDIVIYIGELKDSSLRRILLAKNARYLCASPEYVGRMGMPLSPDELHRHHCIALRENSEDVTLWRFTERETGKTMAKRIRPLMASNDGQVVKQWGLAGEGIIVRSAWDVEHEVASGGLVKLLTQYELPDADIVALVAGERLHSSPRVDGFITLLKERLSKRPWEK